MRSEPFTDLQPESLQISETEQGDDGLGVAFPDTDVTGVGPGCRSGSAPPWAVQVQRKTDANSVAKGPGASSNSNSDSGAARGAEPAPPSEDGRVPPPRDESDYSH